MLKTTSSPLPIKFESDSSAPSPPAPIGFASPLKSASLRADLKEGEHGDVLRQHHFDCVCRDSPTIKQQISHSSIECTYHCALSKSFSLRSTSSNEKCLKIHGMSMVKRQQHRTYGKQAHRCYEIHIRWQLHSRQTGFLYFEGLLRRLALRTVINAPISRIQH